MFNRRELGLAGLEECCVTGSESTVHRPDITGQCAEYRTLLATTQWTRVTASWARALADAATTQRADGDLSRVSTHDLRAPLGVSHQAPRVSPTQEMLEMQEAVQPRASALPASASPCASSLLDATTFAVGCAC